MAMNEQCKHFQSRTYDSGEVARFCQLDLAPEAPWRCPADCPKFDRRLADVGWVHGSLVEPPVGDAPEVPSEDLVEVLSGAEAIVNDVAPAVLAEVRAEEAQTERKGRWPFFRRRG